MLNTRRRRALACAGAAAALSAAIAPQAMAGPLNAGGSVDLLTDANVKIGNLAAAAKVGDKIVSAGDFNGDGFKDVALGMWMLGADGPTRAQAGAIYVVYGKPAQARLGRPGGARHQRRAHRGRGRERPRRLVAGPGRRRQRRRQGRPADRHPVGRSGHARQDQRRWRADRLRPQRDDRDRSRHRHAGLPHRRRRRRRPRGLLGRHRRRQRRRPPRLRARRDRHRLPQRHPAADLPGRRGRGLRRVRQGHRRPTSTSPTSATTAS